MKLSVIIPGEKEPFMQRTIDSLLAVSELGQELEVIAVLDGPWMTDVIKRNGRVRVIQFPRHEGMRAAINAGLDAALGEFVMKVDAHCLFAPGFDKAMVDCCQENWMVIPRRYSLEDADWSVNQNRPAKDYHYLNFPVQSKYGLSMSPQPWVRRGRERAAISLDDTMTFQGSCWIANREFFMNLVGFLDDNPVTYGTFAAEQLESGLKYWLSGKGEVKVNKATWYAHLSKQPRHRLSGQYIPKPHNEFKQGWTWATEHWVNDKEPDMAYSFSWLVEKFWPVPGWPEHRNLWRL